MKIHEIEYHNIGTGWKLEKTTFSDITLLVGISGVGKTQILHTINNLRSISAGQLVNGAVWSISFTADNQKAYRWEGGFQHIKGLEYRVLAERKENEREESNGVTHVPKILYERLFLEDTLILEKQENHVSFNNQQLPIKFSPYKSILTVFTEQEEIVPVLQSFKKIYFVSDWIDIFVLSKEIVNDVKEVHNITTLQQIQDAPIAPRIKLVLVNQQYPDIFESIKEEFIDIFPQVEDIQYTYDEGDGYTLQIREKGTNWIPKSQISSGMFKTLMHIAEMKLMANGSVILIDEFENSLGVNCIEVVADILMNQERDLQYIITSHHPYIINNIPSQYWQIVTRQGGKVSTHSAADLHLERSKHQAFMQLLNSERYTEGIH